MSTTYTFTTETRTSGKHWSRKARIERKVPAVIYGPKRENKNVLVDEREVKKYSGPRFESAIFSLNSDDKDLSGVQVLIKDIHYHPVSDRPVHMDLYALDMTKKVRVFVVIEYTGTPIGVKEQGGLLQVVLNELEIECLPTNIPTSITVDLSHLNLNESVHVSDITMPADVKAVTSSKRTLATVGLPKEEKEPEAVVAEGAAPADGAAAAPAAGGGEDKKS